MLHVFIYVVFAMILEVNSVFSYPTPINNHRKYHSIEDISNEDNATHSLEIYSQCLGQFKNCTCHTKKNIRTKRDLQNKIETNFVKKFFENNLSNDRILRNSQSEGNLDSADDDEDEENENKEKGDTTVIKDKQFKEKQAQIANITNSTKFLFDQIENVKLENEEEDKQCCDEEEKKPTQALIASSKIKGMGMSKSNEALQMHFYKKAPSINNLRKLSTSNKPRLVNLYPGVTKAVKLQHTPGQNNYIKLVSKGNKFVEVPAIRLTVVPEESSERRRRRSMFKMAYSRLLPKN